MLIVQFLQFVKNIYSDLPVMMVSILWLLLSVCRFSFYYYLSDSNQTKLFDLGGTVKMGGSKEKSLGSKYIDHRVQNKKCKVVV